MWADGGLGCGVSAPIRTPSLPVVAMWPCGRVAGCPRCGLCGFPSADFGWWLADWEQTSQAVPGSALAKVAFPSQLAADNCSSVEPTVWRRHALTRSRQHWAVLLLELERSVLKTVGIGNRFFFSPWRAWEATACTIFSCILISLSPLSLWSSCVQMAAS